jgi:signal transduction histidine kinase
MNLLTNAFKYTRAGGSVVLRAFRVGEHVHIEVEDECGGFPESHGDPFQPFADRRGRDRSGLGLGLSITRKAVAAHGGDLSVRNLPGKGCVFVIDLAMSGEDLPVPPANRRPEPGVKVAIERRHHVRRQHGE